MITLRQLLACYDLNDYNIPDEVLNIKVSDSLYDKKCLIIKNYFISLLKKNK